MEGPYAKWIFGSSQHHPHHHHRHRQPCNNSSNHSLAATITREACQRWKYPRNHDDHHKPNRLSSMSRSSLNIFMVVTTICITMIASAGIVSSSNAPLASALGAGGVSAAATSTGVHRNGGGGGRGSRDNNNNNGHSSSGNPYQQEHHHHHSQQPHPDISHNGGDENGEDDDGSSTNPFAYWTSVTHHYNSYITHPNYHYSSSSSSSSGSGGSSPYNHNNNNNNYNGHNYNFGVLLNSDNEASTALFLNASTPPTPADKKGHSHGNGGSGSDSSGGSKSNNNSSTGSTTPRPSSKYTLFQQILIAWGATCLGLLTVVGNILVMISFKIDKQLQTISNYFLFSLAVADFLIGTIGMPLSTVYLLAGYWPFGERVCDAWLAVDYLTSNASVLNLLMISFDRYFSVTRPLTYRAKRTTRRAAVMISAAWGISLLLWPPWIYAWPYIEGKRTVPEYKCYIQFIETNHYITFGTAIAAFYIPVSIMLFLYYRIYMETEKRQRDLSQLQAGKKESSRRSNSSDEAMDVEEWKRMRSGSCTCQDHLDQSPSCPAHKRQSPIVQWLSKRWHCLARACEAFIGFCRVDRDADDQEEQEEEHVSPGCGTPASIETPLQSSVSRCTSLNVIRDPLAQTPTRRNDGVISPLQTQSSNASQTAAIATTSLDGSTTSAGAVATTTTTVATTAVAGAAPGTTAAAPPPSNKPAPAGPNPTPNKEGSNGKLPTSESVYTILIRIPGETEGKNASIRMIQDPGPLPPPQLPGHHQRAKTLSSNPESVYSSGSSASAGTGSAGGGTAGGSGSGGSGSVGGLARRPSGAVPPLHAKIIPKPLTSKGSAGAISATSVLPGQQKRKKKKNQEKKQEKKAAKTLSAILLAFIVTWTPYNILVLLKTIMVDDEAIPEILWNAAYYLCYINSTINPMCYALCNASFRRTYIRILTCKWENTRRQAVQRGYYN